MTAFWRGCTLTVLLFVLWFVRLFCDGGLWLSRRGRMSLTSPTKAMQRPLGGTQCSLSVPGVFLSSSLAPISELILFARAVRTLVFFLVLAKTKKTKFFWCVQRKAIPQQEWPAAHFKQNQKNWWFAASSSWLRLDWVWLYGLTITALLTDSPQPMTDRLLRRRLVRCTALGREQCWHPSLKQTNKLTLNAV